MSWYKEAVCMRCGRPLDGKFYDACPKCAEESVNVNYRTIYDLSSAKLPAAETTQPGIYRFRDFIRWRTAIRWSASGKEIPPSTGWSGWESSWAWSSCG